MNKGANGKNQGRKKTEGRGAQGGRGRGGKAPGGRGRGESQGNASREPRIVIPKGGSEAARYFRVLKTTGNTMTLGLLAATQCVEAKAMDRNHVYQCIKVGRLSDQYNGWSYGKSGAEGHGIFIKDVPPLLPSMPVLSFVDGEFVYVVNALEQGENVEGFTAEEVALEHPTATKFTFATEGGAGRVVYLSRVPLGIAPVFVTDTSTAVLGVDVAAIKNNAPDQVNTDLPAVFHCLAIGSRPCADELMAMFTMCTPSGVTVTWARFLSSAKYSARLSIPMLESVTLTVTPNGMSGGRGVFCAMAQCLRQGVETVTPVLKPDVNGWVVMIGNKPIMSLTSHDATTPEMRRALMAYVIAQKRLDDSFEKLPSDVRASVMNLRERDESDDTDEV